MKSETISMKDDHGTEFGAIRADLREEYGQFHDSPWIIGYSGGKDSTLVVHLVIEMLLNIAPSRRKRSVHIVSNDTLVESPLVINHVVGSIREIRSAADAFGLPVITEITRPVPEQSFWVNMIGRGYAPPTGAFRWCTDRMKIGPTSRYIRNQVDDDGKVILLLGVRRSESSARAAVVDRHDSGGRLHKHPNLAGCMVYRPIVDLETDDVWEFLAMNSPPWGGSHQGLIDLYRNAGGGECPVITSKDDAPSCGTSSSRFGCWTCTVVKKDRSLEGLVKSGFDEFTPLLDFRDWLLSIRNDKDRRQARRRNGRITVMKDGRLIPGPFTMEARAEILERLQTLQNTTCQDLITDDEVNIIHEIWSEEIMGQAKVGTLDVHQVNA